jgi:hypothetical protein
LIGDGRAMDLGEFTDSTSDAVAPAVKGHLWSRPEGSLMFSVGTDNNDRRIISLDGYSFMFRLGEVTDSTMRGSWDAGVYVAGHVQSGWWCAVRRS